MKPILFTYKRRPQAVTSPAGGLWRGVTAGTMQWHKAVEEE